MISIIIPTLNEATRILPLLQDLTPLRQEGHEIILVDGGSTDATLALASPLVDLVIQTPPGRALQMNRGAEQAVGDMLWFLHADTRVPAEAGAKLLACRRGWGRFDIRLSGQNWRFRVIERMMNLRSRLTGIATGDQGIFIRLRLFNEIGGYPEIPLMEDIALSKRLRKRSVPDCLNVRLTTASRRWERQGIVRTILLMWWLRLAYFLGVNPQRLAKQYECLD